MVQEIQSLSHLNNFTSDATKVVVIDFYADWCGPCKMIAPHYERLSTTFQQTYGGPDQHNGCSVVFLKCNVDRCRDVASHFKVTSMPTFVILCEGGKEVERFAGADIGRVERVAKNNLLYIASQRKGSGPTTTTTTTAARGAAGAPNASSSASSSATTDAAAASSGNPAALLNAAARYLTNISVALQKKEKDCDEVVSKLSKDLHTFLKSQTNGATPATRMPLGTPLIPFLMADEYPRVAVAAHGIDPLNTFLEQLIEMGNNAKNAAAAGFGNVVCKDGVCSIVPPNNASSSVTTPPLVTAPWALTDTFTPAEDAVAIVVNIARIAVNALTFETWHVVGANNITAHTTPNPADMQFARMMQQQQGGGGGGNPTSPNSANTAKKTPAPYNGRWHVLLHRLLKSDMALKVLFAPGTVIASSSSVADTDLDALSLLSKKIAEIACPNPLVNAKWMKTGKQLELNTLLGALLSPGLFPARASLHSQQIQMMAMLYPNGLHQQGGSGTDMRMVKGEIEQNASLMATQIHNAMDAHVDRCFPIFRELLGKKGHVRTSVLRWLQSFFAANAGFTKTNREKAELCSETAMLSLSHVLVELALPIINANGFEKNIPTAYYADLNAFTVPIPQQIEALLTPKTAVKKKDGGDEETDAATSKEDEEEDAVKQEMKAMLSALMNGRSIVHFGLNRSDVERVCHFKVLKNEILNDYDAVQNIMAANAAAVGAIATDESFPLPTITRNGGGVASPTSPTGAVATTASTTDADALLTEALLNTDGVNYYPPRVHIFFMALRAISLSQTVALSTLRQLEQQANHPRTSSAERPFLMTMISTQKAMLTNDRMAKKTVQFLNGAARWLLHILGTDFETGKLPTGNKNATSSSSSSSSTTTAAAVPDAWKLMPQAIIDEVLTSLSLVTKYNIRSIHPTDIDDIISLFLVLMGNLDFFPKAHTHALFPTIILELLQNPIFAPALTRHRWYQSNIVLGCIRTYIAMEKCYYDKTSCRYYLSVCLKRFLAEDVLCYPARPTLLNTSDRLLEKFTHMVTTEANQAIDDVLTALAQMRVLEAEGKDTVAADGSDRSAGFNNNANNRRGQQRRRNNNNRRSDGTNHSIYSSSDDDNAGSNDADNIDDVVAATGGATGGTVNNNNVRQESYPQLGERLKNGLLIFSETIVVFKLLSRQFQQGVLQHMVAQQISNMLVQNISKLAGKSSVELKVKNPDLWGFNPRATLDSLVECFVHFRRENIFIQCVLESMHSVSTPENFYYAINNITNPNRTLVVGSLASELREMFAAIQKANVGRDFEEKVWDDEAPEFAFCALMSTPLKDPVVMPMPMPDGGGGDAADYIFVERDVIRHRLLELEENPFSRQRLTEKQLNDYNNQPHIKKAVDELKQKIATYASERRAQLMAEAAAKKE